MVEQQFGSNSLLEILSQAGYWVEAAAVYLEAMPIIGTFVPGQSLIMASGFLVKLKILNPILVWIFGALAAIAGDFTAFLLGKKFGITLIKKFAKYFPSVKQKFKNVATYVDDHPIKALVSSRFNPVTRSVAPFIFGSGKIKTGKFIFYNAISAFSWAAVWVIVGYVFGASYELAMKYISRALYAAMAGGAILWISYYIFKTQKQALARIHLLTFVINILSLYFFVKITEDLVLRKHITYVDITINQYLPFLREQTLTWLMKIVSFSFHPWVLISIGLIFFVLFLQKKKWYEALFIFVSSLGLLIMLATRYLMHRPKPAVGIMHFAGYSFPSFHVTVSIIFVICFVYLYRRFVPKLFWRVILCSSMAVILLVLAFARLYLGAHWFSDILAGAALGVFWMTLVIMIFALVKPPESLVDKIIVKFKV